MTTLIFLKKIWRLQQFEMEIIERFNHFCSNVHAL